jgi:hypothetical protein
MTGRDGGSELRTAELVALLSLATDLGMGQPMEHALRTCLLGMRLADDLGLDDSERAIVYYVCLLAWVGCHPTRSNSHRSSATTSTPARGPTNTTSWDSTSCGG